MEAITRGLFSPNRGAGDKAFMNEMKTKKFIAPENELHMEKFLEKLTPRNGVKIEQVKKFATARVSDLEHSIKTIEAKDKKDPQDESSIEKLKARINAWQMWEVHMEYDKLEDQVEHRFAVDFYAWLKGKGNDREHQMTPWGRARISDPEVRAYLQSFVDAKFDFLEGIQRLVYKAFFLGGLEGIAEHYMFYKYIIRGGWEDRESAEFLYDYNRLFGWDTKVGEPSDAQKATLLAQPLGTPGRPIDKTEKLQTDANFEKIHEMLEDAAPETLWRDAPKHTDATRNVDMGLPREEMHFFPSTNITPPPSSTRSFGTSDFMLYGKFNDGDSDFVPEEEMKELWSSLNELKGSFPSPGTLEEESFMFYDVSPEPSLSASSEEDDLDSPDTKTADSIVDNAESGKEKLTETLSKEEGSPTHAASEIPLQKETVEERRRRREIRKKNHTEWASRNIQKEAKNKQIEERYQEYIQNRSKNINLFRRKEELEARIKAYDEFTKQKRENSVTEISGGKKHPNMGRLRTLKAEYEKLRKELEKLETQFAVPHFDRIVEQQLSEFQASATRDETKKLKENVYKEFKAKLKEKARAEKERKALEEKAAMEEQLKNFEPTSEITEDESESGVNKFGHAVSLEQGFQSRSPPPVKPEVRPLPTPPLVETETTSLSRHPSVKTARNVKPDETDLEVLAELEKKYGVTVSDDAIRIWNEYAPVAKGDPVRQFEVQRSLNGHTEIAKDFKTQWESTYKNFATRIAQLKGSGVKKNELDGIIKDWLTKRNTTASLKYSKSEENRLQFARAAITAQIVAQDSMKGYSQRKFIHKLSNYTLPELVELYLQKLGLL